MPPLQRSELPRAYVALAVFSLLPAAVWIWLALTDDRLRELYLWIAICSTLTCFMPLVLWWARRSQSPSEEALEHLAAEPHDDLGGHLAAEEFATDVERLPVDGASGLRG